MKKISWLGRGLNPDNLHSKLVLYHCATGVFWENYQFWGSLIRIDFALEKHRWRQFWFTTNHLFHVTATQNPNWKINPDLGEAWTLTTCIGSLYSNIVLQESSEKTTSFEGLYRQWYDFALEKHRWRQFIFTTYNLFLVTATQNLIEKNPNYQFLGSLKAIILFYSGKA